MRPHERYATIGLVLFTLGACGEGPAEPSADPQDPEFEGVDFGIPEGTAGAHSAAGEPADVDSLLDREFAIAMPDSLGGLVIVSYDEDTRNVFILQVRSADPSDYACGTITSAMPCHGRYLEGVRDEDGGIQVDGRLALTTGDVTLDEVGPERLTGSFAGLLERTDGSGTDAIEIEDGRIDVDYRTDPLMGESLTCLIQLMVDGTSCEA